MIIARMRLEQSPDGSKALVGKTTCNWQLTPGTPLVLRKRGDEYQLLELGPRSTSRDEQAIFAFCEPEQARVLPGP